MASTERHALENDDARSAPTEGFWRRDEVVYLLHAWRDVAADHVSGSAFHPDDDPAYQQRIFERFCGFYDTGNGDDRLPPRSFKSLMKTKKSLLRSYRFIAMFNQNHVIARSMSALGGSNWFALPDDEQRRVVSAHYKRKPFAYIDEDMFDAIAMIQDMEAQQTQALEQQQGDDDDIPLDVLPPHLQRRSGAQDDDDDDDDTPVRALPSSRSVGRFSRAMRQREPSAPAASPRPVESDAHASGSRFGASWTPEDHTKLLQAWEEVLTEPRALDEPMAVLDRRVYERFQALTGGGNAQRSHLAVRLKRYSLMSTFEFIQAFDRDEIVARPHGLAWFDTTRKYRAGVVQQFYKKSHFAHINADMVATLGRIAHLTRASEQRKASSSSSSAVAAATAFAVSSASPRVAARHAPTTPANVYEDNDSGEDVRTEPPTYTDEDDESEVSHEPWGRHETSLLVNAWSQAETLVQQDPSTRDAVRDLDALIYARFCANCGGESLRARADVAAKTWALELTFELISTFNRAASERASSDSDAPANWFALRKGERDRHIRDAPHECADIDEGTFNELRWIFQVRKQAALLSTLATPVAVPAARPATPHAPVASAGGPGHARAVTVWGRDEVLHLLHAWQDILSGPCPPTESLAALNDRIYSRFVAVSGGTTIRTVKALHAKRDSVVMSYHFIQDFNRGKFASPPPTVGDAWSATDWFALVHDEQKLAVKLYFRKVSFSYLYADMLPAVAKIIAMSSKAATSTPTAASPAASALETADVTLVQQRKPRPNSWMPDELRSFLRAWYEAVVEHPREATETASAFNARMHRRFVELCGGRSKKAEVSLLTKRRVLTSTYEFIAEFNRRAVDEHELDWFRISDVERKRRMILANKVVFTVTNIDEETFLALEQILGHGADGDSGHRRHAADHPSPFWSVTDALREDGATAAARGVASPTATLYDSVRAFIGAKRKPSAAASGQAKRQRVSEPSKALRPSIASPTATLYDSVRAFIGAKRPVSRLPPPVAVAHDRPVLRSKIETRARRRDLLLATAAASESLASRRSSNADAASDSARKKQRVLETHREAEARHLIAITRMFEKQTQHFASLVDAIKAERKTEQTERRELLDAILNNQLEERRKVREEQAAERELAKQRWQEFYEERRAEREQDRLLIRALLAQKEASGKDVSGKDVSESEPVRHP